LKTKTEMKKLLDCFELSKTPTIVPMIAPIRRRPIKRYNSMHGIERVQKKLL
jgi:hypothetical protein